MKDDDGSRDEIFFNQPRYVPHRRVHGVMRVRAAKDALVSMRSGMPELLGPCHTAGRLRPNAGTVRLSGVATYRGLSLQTENLPQLSI